MLHILEVNGYYLPEYELTPQSIFKNEILAFDVNFFNPRADKIKVKSKTVFPKQNYSVGYEVWAYDENGNEKEYTSNNTVFDSNTGKMRRVSQNDATFNTCTPDSIANSVLNSINKEGESPDKVTPDVVNENGEEKELETYYKKC